VTTDDRRTWPVRATGVLVAAALVLALGAGPARAAGSDAATAAFQDRLAGALQKMVDAVVGPGRAVVTTTVELDFDQVETSSTTYRRDPSAGALSERLSRTSYTDSTDGTRYESSGAVRTNALNVVHETRRAAPGRVEKLNIAVLVDAVAGKAVDLAQLRNLVSVAAGADPRRGDVVAVAAMPMNPGAAPAAGSTPTDSGTAPAAGRWPAIGAVLALFIGMLLLASRRKRRAMRISAPAEDLRRVRATLDDRRSASEVVALEQPSRSDGHRQRQISRYAADDPEQAAAVLRGWVGR
jgi:flagellar M-ring protein FliF